MIAWPSRRKLSLGPAVIEQLSMRKPDAVETARLDGTTHDPSAYAKRCGRREPRSGDGQQTAAAIIAAPSVLRKYTPPSRQTISNDVRPLYAGHQSNHDDMSAMTSKVNQAAGYAECQKPERPQDNATATTVWLH
jgi:hypothetical protein